MATLTEKFEALRGAMIALEHAHMRGAPLRETLTISYEIGRTRGELWLAVVEADDLLSECRRAHIALVNPGCVIPSNSCPTCEQELGDDPREVGGELVCRDCWQDWRDHQECDAREDFADLCAFARRES